ncbi:MAG: hypothetical protein ACOX7Q_11885 [Kiritimatiellia bacterium]|jgi:uncharacterized protein YaaN involved in tellurite resistance
MKRDDAITEKLKTADQELADYCLELEKENRRLHKEIARLQAKDVSNQNRIAELEHGAQKVEINFHNVDPT